jgi:protocatechuate 3,4-dioxygenase beta subunit
VNTGYAQPLQVRVTDVAGNPVQGAPVSFSIAPGATGASGSFLGAPQATATTDSEGLATSPPLLANNVPGKFVATASTAGAPTIATFALDNHAAVSTVKVVGVKDESATVNTRYLHSLHASVLDASGQPVEGVQVTFTLTAADNGATATFLGASSPATELTDAQGVATSPPLLANKTAGAFTATAAITGKATPVSYRLTNRAGAPYELQAGAADGETSDVGRRFPVRFAVTVTDKNGNPVPGVTIAFTAPAYGASGHFILAQTPKSKTARRSTLRAKVTTRSSRVARARTNAVGVAIAPPFTANTIAGDYIVNASIRGKAERVAFALDNTRG